MKAKRWVTPATHSGCGAGDHLPRGMGRGLGYSPDHKWLGQGSLRATSCPVTHGHPAGRPYKCETQASSSREKGRSLLRTAFGEGSQEAAGMVSDSRHLWLSLTFILSL